MIIANHLALAKMEAKIGLEEDMNLAEIGDHLPKITDTITKLQIGRGRAQTSIMSTTLLDHMMTENRTTLNDPKMVIMLGEDLGIEVNLIHGEVGETSMDARVVLIRCFVNQ